MIEGGYVLQPRCFDRSDASHFPPVTRELWFYLLRNANFSDRDSTNRGEVLITLNQVMDSLCWHVGYRKETYSKPQLTKSLRRLREGNMIATRKTTRGIVVTICNYDHYQTPGNYVDNDEGTAKETREKEKGHTIHKKVEEGKKEKKKTTAASCPDNDSGDGDGGSGESLAGQEKHRLFSEKFYKILAENHNGKKNVTKGDLSGATDALDKLERIDGYNWEIEIIPTIEWAINDDFWGKQVRSLAALRSKSKSNGMKKFDNIFNSYSSAKPKTYGSAPADSTERLNPDNKLAWEK